MDSADLMEEEMDAPLISDVVASLVYQTFYADTKRRTWTARGEEFMRRVGYSLVHLATNDPKNPISDKELL